MTNRKLLIVLAVAALAACQGEKGPAGATGAAGADGQNGQDGIQGPPGPAGPVTTTNESCMVCHAPTRIAPVAGSHALAFATGTQDSLVLSNVAVANSAGSMQISFHVANSVGAVANVAATDLRVYVAGLVPGASANLPDYFERWLQERSASGYTFGTFANNGSGDYTYTTADVIGSAPAASTVQRIFLRVSKSGQNTGNATIDINKDFTAASNPRDIVPSAACNKCHIARIADHGHGGGYNITEACVVCHSPILPGTDMHALGFDFPTMIHQIHGAITTINDGHIDPVSGRAIPNWGEVTYPANIKDCAVCHNGGAASGNWMTKPTALACGSCHTNVDFTTGTGHMAGAKTDAQCSGCHDATNIPGYHSAVAPANVPEYTATIAISPAPANGTNYVENDTLTVTVTLKNPDGSAVDPALYTNAKHAAGSTVATSLAGARLYVYGPRTAPKPVLTAGAAVTPVPTQSTTLLLPSADANVKTDSTGFKYQLQPIPAGMKGTYFVRFYAQNYGYVSDTNYVTSTNAFTTIQIGTPTVDKKLSGDCTKCHGTGTAPFHDARHAVVFDTDQCVSCHDLSGNHADALANRVHAVHSSSLTGDLMKISWAEVKYPVGLKNGGVENCAVCHDSGNTQFQAEVAEFSCMGCHADNIGAMDHMRQNGGKY